MEVRALSSAMTQDNAPIQFDRGVVIFMGGQLSSIPCGDAEFPGVGGWIESIRVHSDGLNDRHATG